MRAVGDELAARLTETAHRLQLGNRNTPIERTHDEEEDLARMLLAAAWFQVLARNSTGFVYTPLARTAWEDPGAFTAQRLLELPHRDLVADVVAQLHRATDGPLLRLCAPVPRRRTAPEGRHSRASTSTPTPTSWSTACYSTSRAPATPDLLKRTAWQLLGYLLLETPDHYRIDTLGLCLTRSAVLASWPVEDYLGLPGTCRRDLTALRALLAELLAGCPADVVPHGQEDEDRTRRLLDRLVPVISRGRCLVCAQALPAPVRRPTYCSRWSGVRSHTLRKKGRLPSRVTVALGGSRRNRPGSRRGL